MTKRRLIATLLVHNGNVVQARRFRRTNMVGSAFTAVDFFNGWTVDEIMVLEVSYSDDYLERFADILENLSRRCFVPLSVGGKIRDIQTVQRYTRCGADKVVVNTAAVDTPDLLNRIAGDFGSQCLIVSIDARPDPAMPSGYEAVVANGKRPTGLDALALARDCVARGAGEIMVNELEHDGDRRGYDLDLVRLMADHLAVPVIAFGGVGRWEDLVDGVRRGNADAVAAGNIFHYTEHSTKKAKEFMEQAGIPVRHSTFYKVNMPRLPKYEPYLGGNSR
ncbi:MAG: imidazole glycerol phosphate synthase subunit HisF [Desulfovibrionaceae bacterium]